MEREPPSFETIIGKSLLAGLSYYNAAGDLTRQEEVFGHIIEASPETGIVVTKKDGAVFRFPPAIGWLHHAQPGKYTLKSTGDIVENPDFTVTFDIKGKD